MTKDNSTGKNKDFYDLGKKMFDRIQPITRAVPQIPQKHSSKHMTVFELIEVNGLTLHGDIEHFAELVRVDEREACAQMLEAAAKVLQQCQDELTHPLSEAFAFKFARAIEAKLKDKNT
jgi:hypothetical protein